MIYDYCNHCVYGNGFNLFLCFVNTLFFHSAIWPSNLYLHVCFDIQYASSKLCWYSQYLDECFLCVVFQRLKVKQPAAAAARRSWPAGPRTVQEDGGRPSRTNRPGRGKRCVSWWTRPSRPRGGAPLSRRRKLLSWRSCGSRQRGMFPRTASFKLVRGPGAGRHRCLRWSLAESHGSPASASDRRLQTIH